jgi:hypothetical protein
MPRVVNLCMSNQRGDVLFQVKQAAKGIDAQVLKE